MFNNKGMNKYQLIHNTNEGFTKYLIKYSLLQVCFKETTKANMT